MLRPNLLNEIKSGALTPKAAVNYLCKFISENYAIYGKDLYDEDFREDIILSVLENGEKIISNYDESRSDFFAYFYCYVKSLIQTKKRTMAKKIMVESIAISESINEYDKKQYKYDNIDYNCFDTPKIPYSFNNVTQEELQKFFYKIKGDKTLLVLSIKSIFYITDPIVKNVCNYYGISETEFYKAIQFCKETLYKKSLRKEHLIERRNYAYYHHRQYQKKLVLLNDKDETVENTLLKEIIEKENTRQHNNFSKINEKITKGTVLVRPTNKMIAQLLGICERQVEYYLICAKKKFKEFLKLFCGDDENQNPENK